MVGCFLRENDQWVLANPTIGPATGEREATCSSTGTAPSVKLERHKRHHLDRTWYGRWIEVTGKLEKNGRELEVTSFQPVPVAAPRAAAMPAIEIPSLIEVPPAPRAEVPAPPPVATTGVTTPSVTTPEVREQLPHTASPLPLTGLIGFLALASGLVLHRRRLEARG
jgi:hypothetical protein